MCINLDMWECDFHFHFNFINKKSPICYMKVPSIKVLHNENDWIFENNTYQYQLINYSINLYEPVRIE